MKSLRDSNTCKFLTKPFPNSVKLNYLPPVETQICKKWVKKAYFLVIKTMLFCN